tara:strand:+ start:135 stop:623 length:489 start_codon:yes stop_codon:yes gene_type:complete
MYTFDNVIKLHICQYLDKENCCLSSSLCNLNYSSKEWYQWIKDHIKMKNYKIIHFKPGHSTIRWKHSNICTKCIPLDKTEIREIIDLRSAYFHSDDGDMTADYYKLLRGRMKRQHTGYLYIHLGSMNELKMFIEKIKYIFENIIVTNHMCCEGKGVKLMLVQ